MISTRIRSLRKTLKLTQNEFANTLRVSRNNIAGYESGTRRPSEAVISLICSTFSVNEDWLRSGQGDMFKTQSKRELLTKYTENMEDYSHSFKSRFLEAMEKLDEEDWEYLEKLALKLTAHSVHYEHDQTNFDVKKVAEPDPEKDENG